MEENIVTNRENLVSMSNESTTNEILVSKPSANTVQVTATTPSNLVTQAFNEATVHLMKSDTDIQEKILDAAHDCIETEVDTVKTKSNTENTKAKFYSAKDACACYLIDEKEDTTPRWGTAMMKCGYGLILFIYIIIATFSVAPIMFILKKVQTGIKLSPFKP